MSDTDPISLYKYLLQELNKRGILFVECNDNGYDKTKSLHALLRPTFKGYWIANGGFTKESASQILKDGLADMISFGTLSIANNDLPIKF